MSRNYFIGTLMMLSIFAGMASAKIERILEGVYLYNQKVEDGGVDGSKIPVEIKKGLLSNRRAGWSGSGITFPVPGELKKVIIFDLLRDRKIEDVTTILAWKKVHPGQDIGATVIDVSYRAEGQAKYHLAERKVFSQKWRNYKFDFHGASARWIKVEIFRNPNPWQIVPLDEVIIRGEALSGGKSVAEKLPDAASLKQEISSHYVMVDKYGQFLGEDWPGKIKDDSQFAEDIETEHERFAQWGRDTRTYDRYGGLVDGNKKYEATGFFRLTNDDGRWWFITPEGNRFLVIGIDAIAYNANPAPLYKKGTKEVRDEFQELPDIDEFPEAYSSNGNLSFTTANLRRKYGPDFDNIWRTEVMPRRLSVLGFNSGSKWGTAVRNIPYITVLLAKAPKLIDWTMDPFDPGFEAAVERGVKDTLLLHKDDPYLIGHTFDNESGWDIEIIKVILKDKTGDSAAKKRLLEFLMERGRTFNHLCKIFSARAKDIDELMTISLSLPKALDSEARKFIAVASKEYYRIVSSVIKKYDPNHLLLGSSLALGWRSSLEWTVGGREYLDAISIDEYKLDWGWVKEYTKYGKPILLLEYSFSQIARGMRSHAATVPSQRSRGLYYRYIVENLFAQPTFVGAGWYICYDCPATGRYDGECHNQGLFNEVDQPYYEMLEEIVITNRRLMEIHAGELTPVSREILKKSEKRKK